MLFQIAAVALLLVFYGVYMGKKMCQRKQGIQTDLLGKGKTGLVLYIELGLKLMSFAVLIAEVAAILLNANAAPSLVRIMGALLCIAGDTVFIFAILTMRDSWRAGIPQDEKTDLITDGIYRYSRNPAFLGFDLIYIGILLMFFSWWLLGITALTILMFHLQIVKVEEAYMLSAFGEEYLTYQNRVKRYLGRKR